jgi:hypothetical protein
MKNLAWLPLAAVLALGACDDDDDPVGNQLYAHTRIVNATPVAAHTNVRMYADDERIGTIFSFGTASVCNTLTVPEGTRNINFRTADSTLVAEMEYEFVSGVDYVIALMPDPANAAASKVAVFEEPYPATVTEGMNAVRVINATRAIGEVVFTTAGGTVTTTTPARTSLTAGASTAGTIFPEVATGSSRVRMYAPGTATNPVGDFSISAIGTPRTATVFFTVPTVERPTTGLQLNRCIH